MSTRPGAAEEEDASELKLGDDFVKAKCLMNAEVALVLQRKYEQLQALADDPSTQISHGVQGFEKSLQYVKRFSRYQNPEAVKQVREVLSRNALAEFEKKGRMDDEKIETMLTDLATIKKFE